MRNIILEGPDAVGKSTLAAKLRDKYNLTIIHSTSKTRNDLGYHLDLLDYRDNTILERFHVGEGRVYPDIYNRPKKLTDEEYFKICRRIIENNDCFIIYTCSDISILEKRLIERGELDYLQEIQQQVELFEKAAIEFKNRYNYKHFYICDIAEDNAYEKLDKWIDEHFGQVNINIAYRKLCRDIYDNGHRINSINLLGSTTEVCNYLLTIDDVSDYYHTLVNAKTNLTYLAAELLWYFTGRNDVDFISKFAPMWEKLTDDGITNNSSYGDIIFKRYGFDQFKTIIDLLRKDTNSRRAVMNFNVPNENVATTKDEICTISTVYQIRDDKLHCTLIMRSSDIFSGFRNDIGAFVWLQHLLANELNVELGSFTYFAVSSHFYHRDFDRIKATAFGTLETINERLDIKKLISYKKYLVEYVDAIPKDKFDKKEFTNLLKELNVIYEVGY